jgi:hypothetical protein
MEGDRDVSRQQLDAKGRMLIAMHTPQVHARLEPESGGCIRMIVFLELRKRHIRSIPAEWHPRDGKRRASSIGIRLGKGGGQDRQGDAQYTEEAEGGRHGDEEILLVGQPGHIMVGRALIILNTRCQNVARIGVRPNLRRVKRGYTFRTSLKCGRCTCQPSSYSACYTIPVRILSRRRELRV